MRYLLDTHLLLWWMNNDTALSAGARSLISDSSNDVAYSAATVWEIAIKHALEKLDIPPHFLSALRALPFSSLSVTADHAWEAGHLPFVHKDPFDRLLVAQAQLDERRLLTVDRTLIEYGEFIELV